MKLLFLFVLSFSLNKCFAFNIKDIENKFYELTSGMQSDDSTVVDVCSKKCSQDIEELKTNITELYMAFLALHAEFAHLNQHMLFHEKALKHIAIWGHRHAHHHKHNSNPQTSSESPTNSEQHNHPHSDHQHNTRHHNHNSNNHNSKQDNESKEIKEEKKEEKDSSEESKEVESSPSTPSITTVNSSSDLTIIKNIFNESKTKSFIRVPINPKHSIHEQIRFQSMEDEFKEWFDNMLSDIHKRHNFPNDERVIERENEHKIVKHSNVTKESQMTIDEKLQEMEKVLNSEELIFATCHIKPNRHIALLNQQNVEGVINLWQLKHNRGPLQMHIKLKGFKIANHNHNEHHNHKNHNNRHIRESNILPVELEPEEPTHSIGISHSHGFHVHELGNLSRDCQSVGSHYNPLNLAHGGPYDVIRHVGDLGNIRCDNRGQIDSEFTFSQISLSGEHSIINRSLVIHSNTDDYGRNPNSSSSITTGSSGVRIACCVIEEVNTLPKEDDSQSNIGPVAGQVNSKRRREVSQSSSNRYEDLTLSELLKKIAKYENKLKFETNVNFKRRTQRRHQSLRN